MLQPGNVVTVDFPGTQGIKRRPAVIVSSETYHDTRPDIILGLLTTQINAANAPTDYILQDWKSVGLRSVSAFRVFLVTMPSASVKVVGHLSDRDWRQVQERLKIAIATK